MAASAKRALTTDSWVRERSYPVCNCHCISLLPPCHLKGYHFKLGLTDDPACERCLEEDESATHILCDCEAIAYLRFRHMGQFFMEPSGYYEV
jgi:hypothetical protein